MENDKEPCYESPFNDKLGYNVFVDSSSMERTFPVQTKEGIVLVTLPKVFFIHIYLWRAIKKAFIATYRIFETDRHRMKREFIIAECKRCLDETWNKLENEIMSRGYDIFQYFHMLRAFRDGKPDKYQIKRAEELGCRMDSLKHTLADLIARKEMVYNPKTYRETVFKFLDEMSTRIDSLCNRGMPTEGLRSFLSMKQMAEFELFRDMALSEREVEICQKQLPPGLLEKAKELYQNSFSQQPQETGEQQLVKTLEGIMKTLEDRISSISSAPLVVVRGNGNQVSFGNATIAQTIVQNNLSTVTKGDFEAAKIELSKIPELNGHVEELISLLRDVKDKPLDEKRGSVTSWIESLKKIIESGSRKVLETATINLILKVAGEVLGIPFI